MSDIGKPAFRAVLRWTCFRCDGDCRETVLNVPNHDDFTLTFLACIGMNCDLVYGTANGAFLGHQFNGLYVPATAHELEHGPS